MSYEKQIKQALDEIGELIRGKGWKVTGSGWNFTKKRIDISLSPEEGRPDNGTEA
jgi:hypothetical protein